MQAATIVGTHLEIRQHPDPVAAAGELLVRMRATSINGADIAQIAGHYPPPPGVPQDIPGLDCAGEVVAVGAGVTRHAVGDRVMAIVGGGGMAEFCRVHESHAIAIPESAGWDEAGGFPEVFTTAHDALFTQAGLRPGERLLINGAAGGVGVAAVQLALAAGASVIASVRDATARQHLPEVIGSHNSAALELIDPARMADIDPVDVVLELVGGPNIDGDLRALRSGGRISVIGTAAGRSATLDLGQLMLRRARIHGSTLRSRTLEQKADAARRIEREAVPLWARGQVRVPIIASFTLSDSVAAVARFTSGAKLGKVIVTVG